MWHEKKQFFKILHMESCCFVFFIEGITVAEVKVLPNVQIVLLKSTKTFLWRISKNHRILHFSWFFAIFNLLYKAIHYEASACQLLSIVKIEFFVFHHFFLFLFHCTRWSLYLLSRKTARYIFLLDW